MRFRHDNPSRARLFAASVAVVLTLGWSAQWAFGENVTDLEKAQQDAIEAKEKELKEINEKIKAYNDIVKLKQKQGATLADQIAALEAQAARITLEIERNRRTLEELGANLVMTEERISAKERIMAEHRSVLSELIRQTYADSAQGDLAVFAAQTGEWYLTQEEWTTQAGQRISALITEIIRTRNELVADRERLARQKAEADTLRLQLDERNDYLDGAKTTKAKLLSQTQSEQNKYSGLVDQLKRERDQIENEIEDIESGKIDAIDLSKMPKFKKGLLEWPIDEDDFRISQNYGKTSFAKTAYKSGFHNGVDFAASVGTPVTAPMDGKVVGVGNNGKYAYGKWVAIDHGNGITTLYGHLSSQDVKKGDKVDEGERIGKVGNTGYSTGPHLHFSIFSSSSFELVESSVVDNLRIPVGASVNPMYYLP